MRKRKLFKFIKVIIIIIAIILYFLVVILFGILMDYKPNDVIKIIL
ncbi:hypothetical protein [Marinitoga hydrogenitolerans]|nr:hypothetical protein [Marinitoga hydrogenitolerans]